MSYYDDWLLEGSEPEPWDEDSAPHGLCEFCEQPLDYSASEGEFCAGCGPVPHEALDLLATFEIDTSTGAVSELVAS